MNPANDNTRAPRLALAVTILALLMGVASGVGQAATGRQQLRVYAVPSTAQFMNHADDRVRGMSINPFNVNLKKLQVVLATNGKEKGNGPFPGDDVLYTFKLYSDSSLKASAGSAMFTCYYGYGKRATCDSYFDFRDGLVLASGEIVFNSKQFTLGISGGTSKYLGASGELKAFPAAKSALRINLVLLDLAK
jgi:hypothetical protein